MVQNFVTQPITNSMERGRGNKLELTEEQKLKIIEQMYSGISIRKICEQIDCRHATFFAYLERDPIFAKKIDQARRDSAHVLADDLLNEYDNAETMTHVKKADGKSKNLQWLASKRHPETYGERLDVNHNVHVDLTIALNEGQARLDKYLGARDVTPAIETVGRSCTSNEPVESATCDKSKDETKE